MYNFGLKDKTVIVTGAAGQLGRKFITALLNEQCNVVAIDVDIEILQAVSSEEEWDLKRTLLFKSNIVKLDDVKEFFEKSVEKFGSVDVIINNAGVSVFEHFMDRAEESIDFVMDVNLKGTFFCIREFLKCNKKSNACIVNIASLYGIVSPDPRIYTDCDRKNSEIYGATKAGVIQMTRYFAVHAAESGVRVNSVSLGGVRNHNNPQGEDFQKHYGFRCPIKRMAEVEEIVWPVLFLCSDAASYVNGHNFIVDGGFTAW